MTCSQCKTELKISAAYGFMKMCSDISKGQHTEQESVIFCPVCGAGNQVVLKYIDNQFTVEVKK